MKNLNNFIIAFSLVLCLRVQLTAQGDCVIVIQGTRSDPKEAFFKNSADNFITAMGAMSPAPAITVLRPSGESSMLGTSPTRTESNYDSKADLKAKIRAALCKEECKDVIITLIGHGMGGDGIHKPPPNKDAGGMKIGAGNTENDYLLAADIAALIDSCKKSVKIIASECFAESMINGICKVILNKGLIGVAIGSSLWNEESIATGSSDANMTYEFLMNFLKNYYLIIGNPNTMADIIKAAEELKKKNDEYNKSVAEENKAREIKINDCEKMLADMKKQLADLKNKIDDTNAKIKNAEAAKKLLEERKELEKEYNAANNKDKKEIKKKLDTNKEDLKKLGVKNLPSGKLDKVLTGLDAEIAKLDQAITDLNAALVTLNADWMALNKKIIDKEFELDKIKSTPPKSPIPDHLPVNEIIIHEAFKSAKALTKSSHGVEPVPPKSTGPVEVPKTPPTDSKIGDNYFVYYKVIDKKTGKCVVVGYRRDKLGNPIGPIKSIECAIDCSKLKFSYNDNGTDKVVEATRQTDNSYKYTQDGQEVSYIPGYKKLNLIKPGELLAEAYCQVHFNSIPDVLIPDWTTANINYDAEQSLLSFNMLHGTSTHQVFIQFMPHEDVMINIDMAEAYLHSLTRRYTLIDQNNLSAGKLGLIEQEGGIVGNFQECTNDLPVEVIGQLSEDLHRFMLNSMNTSNMFQASPLHDNPTLMVWSTQTNQGVLHPDLQNEPYLAQLNLTSIPQGPNILQWQYNIMHMTESELEQFSSSMIVAYDAPNLFRVYNVPFNQNTWVDEHHLPSQPTVYRIYPVMLNNVYCVPYDGILFDEFGMPSCITSQNVIIQNKRETATPRNEDIIMVMPNPFHEKTNIHIYNYSESPLELNLFELTGKLLKQFKFNSSIGWNSIPITKDDLNNPGMYIYELKLKDKLQRGKLILK